MSKYYCTILMNVFTFLGEIFIEYFNYEENYFQNDLDIESESVMNMRIVSSLARLSRIHVVQLHNPDQLEPDPSQLTPPPDYETAEEIKKKEEEELPTYCQAVSSSSCHM